jgi:hypothetical protein
LLTFSFVLPQIVGLLEAAMGSGTKLVLALFVLGIPGVVAQTPGAAAPAPAQPQIGYKAAADAEQKKTLQLRDYQPVQMLHVPAHQVPKGRFYVIDVHNHVNDAAGIDEHMDPKRVIEVMNNTYVKRVVILTGLWGD